MAIRSMTGFARVRRSGESGEIIVTLKSVNHRALDIHTHLPADFDPFDPAVRAALRRRIARGHVDVKASFTPLHAGPAAGLNKPLFEAYLNALDQARGAYGITAAPDLHAALQIPGMLAPRAEATDEDATLEPLLLAALEDAITALNQFREREGQALAEAMREANARVRTAGEAISAGRANVTPALRERLSQRMAELLADAPLDPQRVVQETALAADRSAIDEEIARLMVHVKELDQLLTTGAEIGKKLDFLLQEMNREVNTILSKTAGLGEIGLAISGHALDAKSQIEKIREQALNLE